MAKGLDLEHTLKNKYDDVLLWMNDSDPAGDKTLNPLNPEP